MLHFVDRLPPIEAKVVGLDIETTTHTSKMANPWTDEMTILAVSDGKDSWALRSHFESAVPLITDPNVVKIAHNAKFDFSFIKHFMGCQPANIWDTLIIERILYAGVRGYRHRLEDILERRIGETKDSSLSTSFGDVGALSMEQQAYIEGDVLWLPTIREQQLADLGKTGMGKVGALENRLIMPMVDMYLTGVGFDVDLWKRLVGSKEWQDASSEVDRHLLDIEHQMRPYIIAPVQQSLFGDHEGLGVNLNSNPQVLELLGEMGFVVESTGEDVIQDALDSPAKNPNKPFLELLLEWRKWNKRGSRDFLEHVNPVTGRIHAEWNQTGARTGRTACSDPNLQNLERPKPNEPNMREPIIPDEEGEYVFFTGDFAQQEPRIFAQISGDERLMAACNTDDVYIATARDVLGRDVGKGSEERFWMKTGILAYFYGAGPEKLARLLSLDVEGATAFSQDVSATYPVASGFAKRQLRFVLHHGYTTTLLGRRNHFQEAKTVAAEESYKYKNQAVNSPVQGTGGDMLKLALCKVYEYMQSRGLKGAPVMQIHDELVVLLHKDEAEEAQYSILGCMEEAGAELCPDVKTIAEGKISRRWEK